MFNWQNKITTMKLHIIAIGDKLPTWINTGCADYQKRLKGFIGTDVIALPAPRRNKNATVADNHKHKLSEGQAILNAKKGKLWVLDVKGVALSTEHLAQKLQTAMLDGQDISLVIGGADGVSDDVLAQADFRWSLSDLTLPHPLVRVILLEQLYRAMSILHNHPYHRGE